MTDQLKTTFPDPEYLKQLAQHEQDRALKELSDLDKILVFGNVAMNWLPDIFTDTSVIWRKEKVSPMNLVLTGTNPKWNAIIIDQCERSPLKLKEFFQNHPDQVKIFAHAQFHSTPILIRQENDQSLRVLDGMNRVIAAIRDDITELESFIAQMSATPKPQCQPHLVYDLLRSYHRKINTDRAGLITTLKWLRKSYANVDWLLSERFKKSWVPSDEIQEIIQEALQ